MMISAPRIPFVDLSWQWREIESAFMPELRSLFESGAYCLGDAVDSFEHNFAAYVGTRHAVGVSSGTAALHLAVIAAGIKPGDKVLLPSHTFIATAWALLYVGAEPVLCDVEPVSGTIDLADAERRMQPGVRAIIPVHLYGQPANMRAVHEFVARHGLVVIEDAAQAHGACFDRQRVGTFGKFACFSFYPSKNLGAAGESGLVTTDDDAAAARMRALRDHGQVERYLHAEIGFNYRMEGIQGLILDHKLRHLNAWTEVRKRLARRYIEGLRGLPLALPEVVHSDHVYHLFVVRTPRRDGLRAYLRARGIASGLHYPVPLHRQPCFRHLDFDRTGLPVADQFANECLSLPLYVGMDDAQVDEVIDLIRSFLLAN
jgi:dTDP-4-amino-4,6-dideoxygalactose transaminase